MPLKSKLQRRWSAHSLRLEDYELCAEKSVNFNEAEKAELGLR
jgi:hypothetical protein